jgi:Lanthionine synthetase C-like protein
VLYAPESFAPLTETPWHEGRVRDSIAALIADADGAYSPDALWPAHEWDGWQAALPLKNLYVGAAGVAWALDVLRRRGFAEPRLDPADVACRALEAFRAAPDFMRGVHLPAQKHSALLTGEAGIALVAWLLRPSDEVASDLLDLVRQNVGNDANELMWGVPGTLLAARAVLERTGEERWRAAVRESEDALREARDDDGLWTQHLYGEVFRGLTAPHGLVGNVAALGEPGNAPEILRAAAVVEDGRTNWISADGIARLQWCAGAPGIVSAAAGYLDEELVLAGAELTWEAGPRDDEKGAGICHGTAGNGYALLKTFERTGDDVWLERARAFAVHALEQAARLPGRYSLFTGGLGAGLFAADCVDARAWVPVLDGF